MIRYTAKEVSIEIDEPEDVVELLKMFLSKLNVSEPERSDEKHSKSNAERCKRYRENKKRVEPCRDHVATMSEPCHDHVGDTKEEREEKEAVSPLIPSSLSSFPPDPLINYPITPLSPLSEEKEEREENVSAAGENEPPIEPGKRGKLNEFGEYVMLSGKEYGALLKKFGEEKTLRMISNMNLYIGEDPKRIRTYASRNHYLTLLNWERMDQERKQPKQIPKEKTFADIARELREKEEDNVIDSFWRI